MYARTLGPALLAAGKQLPIVTLTGPRQSGKTTLARTTFPNLAYASLEDPDTRERALTDPRGFLRGLADGAVLDEIQRAPDLLSYIQGIVDDDPRPGRFVLTGSQNLLLLESVSQSLAGRTRLLNLHPLSLSELERREPWDPETEARPRREALPSRSMVDTLHAGFYPRIHERGLDAASWLADYRATYVERDVRRVINVQDLEGFTRFLGLCAGRNAQLLNSSSLAGDAGVDHTTVRRWLSLLEASFLITLLRPHHRNFRKRLTKGPKIYFLDSGLLCSLLGIRAPSDLAVHASRGAVFETFVLSELVKAYAHRGSRPPIHFWRDSTGREVDFLIERGSALVAIEAKSGETVPTAAFDGLAWWRRLVGDPESPALLVHGGDRSIEHHGMFGVPWHAL
jgi:hypothetical protein